MHSSKLRIIVVAQIIYMTRAMPNKVNMPNECEKQNFCFKADNSYPYEDIKSVIQKYNISILDENNPEIPIDDNETEKRIDGDQIDEMKQPCNSITKRDPIYYIRDTNGDVRYVVQSNNTNLVQRFYVVQCSYPGLLQPSSFFSSEEQICQYNIRCVNRLVPVKFLVLSHDRKGVEMVPVKDGIPMACSCEYDPNPRPFQECNNSNYYDDEDYNAP